MSAATPITKAALAAAPLTAVQWNSHYPPGTPVIYDNGTTTGRKTVTVSRAVTLPQGASVVAIKGRQSTVGLQFLTVVSHDK